MRFIAVGSLLLTMVVIGGCAGGPTEGAGSGPPYQTVESPAESTAPVKNCILVFCRVNGDAFYDSRYCCVDGPQN